jgi:hypothetical protein
MCRPKLEEEFTKATTDALYEINELVGYNYFKNKEIQEIGNAFLQLLPALENSLKNQRGIYLDNIENEQFDHEKNKKAVIQGIFHGLILVRFEGNSFEEKYKNFLYYSQIENCDWIRNTHYDNYYQVLYNITSKLNFVVLTLNLFQLLAQL